MRRTEGIDKGAGPSEMRSHGRALRARIGNRDGGVGGAWKKPCGPKRAVLVLVLAGSAVVTGCGEDPIVCDPCFTSAVIFGAVRDSAGSAVAGVPVEVLAHMGGCATRVRGSGTTTTDNEGRYRGRFDAGGPFTADCFEVTANPEGDPRWPQGRAEIAATVEFRAEYDDSPRDSVRLDLIVPPLVDGSQ
jgi:hypothetical protein